MKHSEILNQAADVIQRRGWAQAPRGGWGFNPDYCGPLCLEGALRHALGSDQILGSDGVRAVVVDYLTSTRPESINPTGGYVIPWAWNDHPDRTEAEVIEVLRACAVIEAAREREDAEVSA